MPDTATTTVLTPDGSRIAYRELGAGPAVLLLHGWPTSSYLWRHVMPVLAENNRVIAPDLPGFGASDNPTDARYDFDMYTDAIDDLLGALGVEHAAIIGHDIGGPIAVRWALDRPERVTALGLLNTLVYPDFSPAVIEFVTALRTPASRDRLTSPDGLAEIMRTGVSDHVELTDDVIAAVQEPFTTTHSRRALARAGVGLGARGFIDIAARLPSLTIPVGVIYGAQDRILPDVAETMTHLQHDLPHASVIALPGCGHFLQEEQPQRVGELLADFLAGG